MEGKTFGKLTVIDSDKDKFGNKVWLCRCECGKEIYTTTHKLTSGHTKSCGCYRTAKTIERSRTHGQSKTPLYHVWKNMRQRCENPRAKAYPRYGGRGIVVCTEWQDYKTFQNWAMNNGYAKNLTIDRIDVNGNYEPANCRFITIQEQQNNRSTSRTITYKGETHTITEWSAITGIKLSTLHYRLKQKQSLDIVFTL